MPGYHYDGHYLSSPRSVGKIQAGRNLPNLPELHPSHAISATVVMVTELPLLPRPGWEIESESKFLA
jgi:hypothetical protein